MIGFLQGPEGEKSSSRLLAAIVVVIVAGVWAVCSIKNGTLQEVPYSVDAFVAAVVGGKLINSIFAEGKQRAEQ